MWRCMGVLMVASMLACTSADPQTARPTPPPTPAPPAATYPPAPPAATGPVAQGAARSAHRLMRSPAGSAPDQQDLDVVAGSGDARLAWLLSDLLRFAGEPTDQDRLVAAFATLTGADLGTREERERSVWVSLTDHLIAWDLPAPPEYRELKAALYEQVEPAWEPFFADDDAAIDWRLVSWGGVYIDDRASGDNGPCSRGCIPALDNPALTDAGAGAWYPDVDLIFGVEVDGQAVAFPKNVMEVHEMVNVTIGSRRVGIPYCTLCGSAQAYLTDAVPAGVDPPVLRTSGLLSRSNKVMYDLVTRSVFDTFTGDAMSGPLQEVGLALEQIPVITTTWRDWKAEHPDTSSWPETAASASSTSGIRSAAVTTAARSSRSVRWTRDCRCRRRCSGSLPLTAWRLHFLWRRHALNWRPGAKSPSRELPSSVTPAGFGLRIATRATWRRTKRSGSRGASSTPPR